MERVEFLRKLLEDHITTDSGTSSGTDDDLITSAPLDVDRVVIYKDEDPYQDVDTDASGVIQVIGNEIITLTRGEGVCCVCHNVNVILYADNSFGGNIPIQVCETCIASILHPIDDDIPSHDDSHRR